MSEPFLITNEKVIELIASHKVVDGRIVCIDHCCGYHDWEVPKHIAESSGNRKEEREE